MKQPVTERTARSYLWFAHSFVRISVGVPGGKAHTLGCSQALPVCPGNAVAPHADPLGSTANGSLPTIDKGAEISKQGSRPPLALSLPESFIQLNKLGHIFFSSACHCSQYQSLDLSTHCQEPLSAPFITSGLQPALAHGTP